MPARVAADVLLAVADALTGDESWRGDRVNRMHDAMNGKAVRAQLDDQRAPVLAQWARALAAVELAHAKATSKVTGTAARLLIDNLA